MDRDYPYAVDSIPQSQLPIRSGTVILTTQDSDLGHGLSDNGGVALYKGSRIKVDSVLFIAADQTVLSGPRTALTLPAQPKGISAVPYSLLFNTPLYGPYSDSCSPGQFEGLRDSLYLETRFGIRPPQYCPAHLPV